MGNVRCRDAAFRHVLWSFALQTPVSRFTEFVLHSLRKIQPVQLGRLSWRRMYIMTFACSEWLSEQFLNDTLCNFIRCKLIRLLLVSYLCDSRALSHVEATFAVKVVFSHSVLMHAVLKAADKVSSEVLWACCFCSWTAIHCDAMKLQWAFRLNFTLNENQQYGYVLFMAQGWLN